MKSHIEIRGDAMLQELQIQRDILAARAVTLAAEKAELASKLASVVAELEQLKKRESTA